jgi:hypothetical protein
MYESDVIAGDAAQEYTIRMERTGERAGNGGIARVRWARQGAGTRDEVDADERQTRRDEMGAA